MGYKYASFLIKNWQLSITHSLSNSTIRYSSQQMFNRFLIDVQELPYESNWESIPPQYEDYQIESVNLSYQSFNFVHSLPSNI